jgi:hypothetical protein
VITQSVASQDPGGALRRGFLLMAGLGILGTAIELATIHHWDSTEQLIPWFMLGIAALMLIAVVARPATTVVKGVRILSVAGLAATAFGIWEHIDSNIEAGPLDRVWGPKWDGLSSLSRFWHAANGDVGPSPLLAPASLGVVFLSLMFATIGLGSATA